MVWLLRNKDKDVIILWLKKEVIMNNEKTIESKENILGVEKIGKLIRKFAIPAIIAMLVNSLYNIVDQIL